MNQRTRLLLYMLAGLYLAYTGGKLGMDVLGGNSENLILYVFFAVLFVAGGIVIFIYAAKELAKGRFEDQDQENKDAGDESDDY